MDLRDAARHGPPVLPRVLRARRPGREGGRPAHGAVHVRPRATTASWPSSSASSPCCRARTGASGTSTAPRSSRRSAAARTGSSRWSPAGRSRIAGSKDYWAERLPVNVGPGQLRRHPLRLLPRLHRRHRGVQGRGVRLPAGGVGEELGDRVHGARRPRGADPEGPVDNEVPTGMQGFAFNTRRAIFRDRRVREALGLRVRLRVEQRAPVLRRVRADAELLLELGAGLARPARPPTSSPCWRRSAGGCPRRCSPASTSLP